MNMIMKFFTYMMSILTRLLSKLMRKKKIKREYDVWDAVNPVAMYLINKPYATYIDFEEIK